MLSGNGAGTHRAARGTLRPCPRECAKHRRVWAPSRAAAELSALLAFHFAVQDTQCHG